MSRAARLGAFILATLAVLAIGIFIIGNKRYLFTDTYELKTQFASVVGLDVGAEVRVGGVHQGTVRNIALPNSPSEKITVVLDLDSSTHHIIKKDSIATIETEGLLGNEYLAVSFGSPGAPDVHSGDTIASQPPLEMAALMKKTDAILDGGQEAMKNVARVAANFSSISAKINNGQGTVGQLVNDKKVYNELDQTMAGLRDTVTQAQSGVADFQEDMEALKHNFFLKGYFKNRGYEDVSEITKDEISTLPQATPIKTFTIDAKQIFDKQNAARLKKNPKSLSSPGDFLADNDFGLAVITAYTGAAGDTAKDRTLTQGRAAVVREYLVENFGFDDSRVKTLGQGKKIGAGPAWGAIQILVYPPGTEIPPEAQSQNTKSSTNTSNQPVQALPYSAPKPE